MNSVNMKERMTVKSILSNNSKTPTTFIMEKAGYFLLLITDTGANQQSRY